MATTYFSDAPAGCGRYITFIPLERVSSVEDTVKRKRPDKMGPCTWAHHDVVVTEIARACHEYESNGTKSHIVVVSPGSHAPASLIVPIKARLAVASRLKVKDESANLAMALAQYRQTASLWDRAAKDVASTYRDLKKGKWSKSASREWLKYQYGILPLLSDINGACIQLDKDTSVGVVSDVVVSIVDTSTYIRGSGQVGSTRLETEYTVRARNYMRVTIASKGRTDLKQTGFGNPAYLAWELIPFSFVIDWLLPVGDWLASLDALNGVDVCGHSELKCESLTTGSIGTTTTRPARAFSLKRSDLDLSIPNPLNAIRYSPSTSYKNIINGLALLRQLR